MTLPPNKAGLLRCGKSCRLQWMNYLRPGIKRGNISQDEEDLFVRLHGLLGNRWLLIAGRLPGPTDNDIKNYWNTHLLKKLTTARVLPTPSPKPITATIKKIKKPPKKAAEPPAADDAKNKAQPIVEKLDLDPPPRLMVVSSGDSGELARRRRRVRRRTWWWQGEGKEEGAVMEAVQGEGEGARGGGLRLAAGGVGARPPEICRKWWRRQHSRDREL